MAFVPGYEHDVFISYGHVDDQPLLEGGGRERPTGWVAMLVRHLSNELAQKIGRAEAFDLWFDNYELRGHHTLNQEIGQKVASAAVFVPILSNAYIESSWCLQEARAFVRDFGNDVGRRVFVVEKAPLDDQSNPPEGLTGRRNYRLWYRDANNQSRTFAKPMPHLDEIDYFRRVEDLARDIYEQLKVMRGGLVPQPRRVFSPTDETAGAPAKKWTVLLAETTDDIEFRRLEVQRYLEQHGALVLPETPYPAGRVEFETALTADLRHSEVFVQLFGPLAGRRPRDVPEGYAYLQFHLGSRTGVSILQWRSPELDLDCVTSPQHRELLELPTVQATSLESFKRAIMDALTPPRPPAAAVIGDRPLIFINVEARHRAIVAEIRAALADRAIWAEPLFEGSAEELREDLEQNLMACDAMVMVYADNAGWVRAQLRNFHKLSPRREHSIRAIPVINVAPAGNPELGFFLSEMVLIDGRTGIGPEVLAILSQSLRL